MIQNAGQLFPKIGDSAMESAKWRYTAARIFSGCLKREPREIGAPAVMFVAKFDFIHAESRAVW